MLKSSTKLIANGKQIRYTQMGTGPSIIFLHGYPENHCVWLPLMKSLSSQYSVLAFDWPGMGGSEVWAGGTTPKAMAKRIVDIMDSFKIKTTHLVGHDMGGQPILVCAAEYPDRILSATVMNSLLIHDAKTSWEIKYLRKLWLNKFFLSYFPSLVFSRALSTFKSKNSALTPNLKNDFWEYFKKKEVRHYIIRMCFGYQAQLPRLPKYYKKIKAPVLLLWSEENKHFDVDHAHRLIKLVPHARLEILKGKSHWLGLTQTIETAKMIDDFIKITAYA